MCMFTVESLDEISQLKISAPTLQYMVRTPLVATLARQLHVCPLEKEANQLAEDFASVIRKIGDPRKTKKEGGGRSWLEVCCSRPCLL